LSFSEGFWGGVLAGLLSAGLGAAADAPWASATAEDTQVGTFQGDAVKVGSVGCSHYCNKLPDMHILLRRKHLIAQK
jgi:hypothetical protein